MFALCPADLGIILSYLCGAACRHCLYNAGPAWEVQPMRPDELKRALDAVATWPRPPTVHFTGGEPFLHFPLLVEGARYAHDLGLGSYVETSASWCRNGPQARARFAALQDAGLDAVLVSCSPFHAERIPPVRTEMAIRAATEVFGAENVVVYLPEFLEVIRRFGTDRPTPLEAYEDSFGRERAARILWQGYGLISGGRSGYALGHLVRRRPASAFAEDHCRAELLYAPHSHFDLYGNFIPAFCGGLALGDWHRLPELLAAAQAGPYSPLIATLLSGGPYGLFELARARHGYEPLPGGYAGKCHLCVDVRRRLASAGSYAELSPRGFYEHLG